MNRERADVIRRHIEDLLCLREELFQTRSQLLPVLSTFQFYNWDADGIKQADDILLEKLDHSYEELTDLCQELDTQELDND